jgi:hypothetical protein
VFKFHYHRVPTFLFFCDVVSCVGRGLCDWLITGPEKYYSVLLRLRTLLPEVAKALSRNVKPPMNGLIY